MKCQDVEILISAYIDGETTASEWREAERHIETCSACAELLTLFQQNDALMKRELPEYAPGADLWAKITTEVESQGSARRSETAVDWLKSFIRRFVTAPSEKVRYAQIGFAAGALLIFVFFMLQSEPEKNFIAETAPVDSSQQTDAPFEAPDLAKNTPEPMLAFVEHRMLSQRLNHYFERAGYLLLEIKNDDSENETSKFNALRKRSTNLLEETVVLKHDLKSPEFALIRAVVEQLEFTLYDIANLNADIEKEDFELLKASILKQDLLIKIEVIDLKKLRESFQSGAANDPAASTRNQESIL